MNQDTRIGWPARSGRRWRAGLLVGAVIGVGLLVGAGQLGAQPAWTQERIEASRLKYARLLDEIAATPAEALPPELRHLGLRGRAAEPVPTTEPEGPVYVDLEVVAERSGDYVDVTFYRMDAEGNVQRRGGDGEWK